MRDAWLTREPFFRRVTRRAARRRSRYVRRAIPTAALGVLAISLDHDHVLYCMNNETNTHPEWSRYWAQFVKAAAARRFRGLGAARVPPRTRAWGQKTGRDELRVPRA